MNHSTSGLPVHHQLPEFTETHVHWVTQLCPTLCNPMDCSPLGSPVHGILQARILEWVAIPFSRGSPQPRDQTGVSQIVGRFFTIWATKPHKLGEATPNVRYPVTEKRGKTSNSTSLQGRNWPLSHIYFILEEKLTSTFYATMHESQCNKGILENSFSRNSKQLVLDGWECRQLAKSLSVSAE